MLSVLPNQSWQCHQARATEPVLEPVPPDMSIGDILIHLACKLGTLLFDYVHLACLLGIISRSIHLACWLEILLLNYVLLCIWHINWECPCGMLIGDFIGLPSMLMEDFIGPPSTLIGDLIFSQWEKLLQAEAELGHAQPKLRLRYWLKDGQNWWNRWVNENWYLWWKFYTLVKSLHFDDHSALGWKFITLMNIHFIDESSSLWLTLISLIKIHHLDENPLLNRIHQFDINTSLWWKFITLIRINPFDNDSSFWWMFRTLMKKLSLW